MGRKRNAAQLGALAQLQLRSTTPLQLALMKRRHCCFTAKQVEKIILFPLALGEQA
jgi:hypothetical protein